MKTEKSRRRPLARAASRISRFAAPLLTIFMASSCPLQEVKIEPVDFGAVSDGTYQAVHETTLVTAEMRAVMVSGVMTELVVIRHECGLGKPAEAIVERVLAAQSLEVDAVSGASYSSKVILKATETALRKGLAQ
jgi:uncharacterized protein with FMN-binding domain